MLTVRSRSIMKKFVPGQPAVQCPGYGGSGGKFTVVAEVMGDAGGSPRYCQWPKLFDAVNPLAKCSRLYRSQSMSRTMVVRRSFAMIPFCVRKATDTDGGAGNVQVSAAPASSTAVDVAVSS